MAGISLIIPCYLDGRSRLSCTTRQVLWRLITSAQCFVPCFLYIDDRHNGQLQVPLNKGQYAALESNDGRNFSAAKSAVFLVAFNLIHLGYFLGLSKSILTSQKGVPFLGFLADFCKGVFHLI